MDAHRARQSRPQTLSPHSGPRSLVRRLLTVLALVTVAALGAGGAAAAAAPSSVPAQVSDTQTAAGLQAQAAATEAPEDEPVEETEPGTPQTDEGTTDRQGPHPIVWFLAAAALAALALGFVVMTRNQRTRGMHDDPPSLP